MSSYTIRVWKSEDTTQLLKGKTVLDTLRKSRAGATEGMNKQTENENYFDLELGSFMDAALIWLMLVRPHSTECYRISIHDGGQMDFHAGSIKVLTLHRKIDRKSKEINKLLKSPVYTKSEFSDFTTWSTHDVWSWWEDLTLIERG